MSRANTIQTNFTSGELSPNMYGRVDVTKYFNGARKLREMIVLPQGGVTRRPGTEYLGAVVDSTKKTIVRTFTFSNNDSYVLEFGHLVVRIWQSGALLTGPVTVVTPYGQNDLAGLRFTQSADVMFIAHPSYHPRLLTRVAALTWTLSEYENLDGPYLSVTPDVDITLSNVVDRATATAVSSIFSTTGSTATITAAASVVVSTSNPGESWVKITTSAAHGFVTGDTVLISGVSGVPECLGAWTVLLIDATNFVLPACRKPATSVYVSGGTAVKASTSLVEFRDDNKWKVARLISVTSGTVATVDVIDTIFYPPKTTKISLYYGSPGYNYVIAADSVGVFTRNDDYSMVRASNFASGYTKSWGTIIQYRDSLETYGQYPWPVVVNFDDATKAVVISGRTITATATASAAVFVSTDVNRKIRFKYGAQWIVGTITAYVSTTHVTVSLTQSVPYDTGAVYQLYNGGKATAWKLGAWSSTTGYPSAVAFHQNRVCWAGTTQEPTTQWFTKTGDYYNFEPSSPEESTVADDSAMTTTLVSRQVNVVRWLDSGPVLLLGTEGAEWQVKPSSIQQSLTPTNVSATVQSAYGSANIEAFRIGSHTLFVERSTKKIREMVYDYSIDSYASKDISILSEHILREHGGVVDWCYQSNPYNFVWLVLGDGKVATMTYESEHEVVAWSLHDFGGVVESCCSVPTASGEDEVYFIVRRTVNGASVRYVERIRDILDPNTFLDCAKKQDFGSVTNITTSTAAAHLVGATVGVTLDGVYLGTKTGAATINVTYRGQVVWAGLLNTPIVGILDPEGGSQAGSSQGKKKRITESNARVVDSYYFQIASATGTTNDSENLVASRDPTSAEYTRIVPALTLAATGSNVPSTTFALVSGDVAFSVDDAFDNGGRFDIVQPEPYQLTITALMHKLNTME